MMKINFLIERIIFFVCGLIILGLLVIIGIHDFEKKDVFPFLLGIICSMSFFLFSFTYHLTYDSESLTIYACFLKRTYLFKDIKNVYVFMYRLYYISFFDSRSIAIPGVGEKNKLYLLFEAIKEKQSSLEIFE
ncbi:hypothetical protein [Treponema sp.]|uniref:hypothetical protein n=1 Tax=Treponema sp. TaxID=166 RepID=UPI0038905341